MCSDEQIILTIIVDAFRVPLALPLVIEYEWLIKNISRPADSPFAPPPQLKTNFEYHVRGLQRTQSRIIFYQQRCVWWSAPMHRSLISPDKMKRWLNHEVFYDPFPGAQYRLSTSITTLCFVFASRAGGFSSHRDLVTMTRKKEATTKTTDTIFIYCYVCLCFIMSRWKKGWRGEGGWGGVESKKRQMKESCIQMKECQRRWDGGG